MEYIEKLKGALYGTAIGDAMGAPVEGWSAARILERFGGHDFATFIPPTHEGDPARGKGAGRITDDTLMTEVLIEAYGEAKGHLDAYGYKVYILPAVKDRARWIPERQRSTALWERLWFPEKYPWMRMVPANAEPRTAGIGNMVNCGVAMWMMPVGAVNAGAPHAAYQEAVLLGSAHNESFAVEAGAVMAAAAAEAMRVCATLDSVLEVAASLARDGTRGAISAAIGAAADTDSLARFIAKTRAAVAPYDQRTEHCADDAPLKPTGLSDLGRPSRVCAIEELPVALAALRYGGGDAVKTLRAAVCYGRDCDSIAGMAMALFGGLYGIDALPAGLCTGVEAANRRDFSALATSFHGAIEAILASDAEMFDRHRASIGAGR
ncbi:MAG: ADP-ribosylglycohydrolase family protein [Kiritimatiellae bacterium]|nr:ADP-ribosylglycohydrolase family protein [Kiritimatiellia bacterium]